MRRKKKRVTFWPRKKAERKLPPGWEPTEVHVEPSEPEMAVSDRLIEGDRVGEGGLCTVDSAFDINLMRMVARKSIKPEMADNESVCGRLIEEAQITAQLGHPNIVPVHELGVDDDGHLYFTMKLIRGKTLNELFAEREGSRLTSQDLFELLRVFLKICDAVEFAHDKEVIHQDLKPDNIMVGEFGEVYVMDWGFAELQGEGRPSAADIEALGTSARYRFDVVLEDGLVGATLFYMAPEQARGDLDHVDERTDIFCLGGILYKMLTQSAPYVGDDLRALFQRILEADVPHPQAVVAHDLPPRLCAICMKAMSKEPDARYQTVRELKQDVESFLQCGWQFERRRWSKGDVVVREGEQGDEAYIIMQGRCVVRRTVEGAELEVGELGPGDVFGELAVFADRPRAATVEALEDGIAIVVTRRDLEEDLGMSEWLGLIIKALANRFIESSRKAAELEHLLEEVTRPDEPSK